MARRLSLSDNTETVNSQEGFETPARVVYERMRRQDLGRNISVL
jgi:hypothetical protein